MSSSGASSPAYAASNMRMSSPITSAFASLPPEILEQVYLCLSIADRLALVRTCSTLRNIYTSSALLSYAFTLETTSYLDIPLLPPLRPSSTPARLETNDDSPDPSDPAASRRALPPLPSSAADKHLALSSRENRWETMDPAATRSFRMSGGAGVYELQEGIFLMCENLDGPDDRPTSVRLIPLPSSIDPDGEERPVSTKSHKVGFSIADLTMDPSQDLIVISEHRPASQDPALRPPTHRYHLLTLSTFQPHPLASLPTLDFPPFLQPVSQTRQLLQVMDDTLVVLVSCCPPHWLIAGLGMGMAGLGGVGSEEEIVCWNWKTGRVLARMGLVENGWFASFALLTPTTFLVTSPSSVSPLLQGNEPRSLGSVFPPVIQIYSFLPDPASHPINPAQPLEADYMDDTTARPIMVAQLELPRFAPGVVIGSFDVRPDPAFPPKSDPACPQIGRGKAFTQHPDKGLLVFELAVMEPPDPAGPQDVMTTKSYELFVLRETLVDMAREGEDRLRKSREEDGQAGGGWGRWKVEKSYPWAEWGVEGSRLMDVSMRRRNWVCSCSGYRFISLVRSASIGPTESDDEHHAQQNPHELLPFPPRRCDLRLFDFSPYIVRKEIARIRRERERGDQGEGGGEGDVVMSVEDEVEGVIDGSGDLDGRDGGEGEKTQNDKGEDEEQEEELVREEPGVKVKVWTRNEPSVLPKRLIWRDEVVTRLPYREVIREKAVRANGVMMDDQRIIAVATRGRRNGDWSAMRQDLTVYCM